MLPGMGQMKVNPDDFDSKKMGHIEAIIQSMTPEERLNPAIINPSRKKRIAAGSGNTVSDVNRLLKQYEQMQKMFKQFGITGRNAKGKRNPLKMPGRWR